MKGSSRTANVGWLCFAGALVVGVLLLWRFSPVAKYADPHELVTRLTAFASLPWAPAAMVGLFVVGGLVSFPLLVLITATATLFQPLAAFAIALTGGVASAALTYFVAAVLLRTKVKDVLGSRVEKVSAALQQQGIIAVATVRLLPIAPFTIVNLTAGSIGLRVRDYLVGTAIGLSPGTAVITAFGTQLRTIIDHPSFVNVSILVAIVIAWIGASIALQRAVTRRHRAKV